MSDQATTDASATPTPGGRAYRKLWFWILVAIAGGIVLGLVAPGVAKNTKWLADLFVQLIKIITGPVIFCTIVVGIASLGNLARAGGLALRALVYFLLATIVSLALGLVVANIVQPGAGFAAAPSPADLKQAQSQMGNATQDAGVVEFISKDLFPSSFLGPFVSNQLLQVVVLAILTACAISMLAPALRERVVGAVDLISKVIFALIRIIMWAAPVGAFGGMAYTVAVFGGGALGNLLKLMVTFWATCAVFVVVALGAVAAWSGFNVFKFIRLIKDELLIIVGTSSSETVLPRLLTKLESAGASRQTVGVVIPTGYSFNLDGTCIYLSMGALFILQAGGVHMPVGTQIALLALMVLTSKGAAGITGAGLVTLAASLQAFGGEFFPPEAISIGIAIVVGIDRVMSEGRALTNCIGNGVATMVIAKLQGERDDARFQAVLDDPRLVDEAMLALSHGSTRDTATEPAHT
ncbi:cation:dicarboxylate symporter family transporter [Pseudonocardia acaciae]|uniref:cation:dicarboxylate symporter family transporter n=1 Tax=Pseudonocardia acaciae TaxID=551276 RepID=UPI0005601D21|nr:cation:dicarboxylase symporter family transporter [Pseudonocardia acaciae]